MTDHVQFDCTCHKTGCMFCDGGLFLCTVCGSAEGATTTECPGVKMSPEQLDAVYAGTLDFRKGAWVNAPSGSCYLHCRIPGLPGHGVSACRGCTPDSKNDGACVGAPAVMRGRVS